jgi:hypothetical protein
MPASGPFPAADRPPTDEQRVDLMLRVAGLPPAAFWAIWGLLPLLDVKHAVAAGHQPPGSRAQVTPPPHALALVHRSKAPRG